MAVRAHIAFYKQDETNYNNYEALIYSDHEESPETTLPALEAVLRDFDANRGLNDIEYSSAWLVRKWKDNYTGIGISKNAHADIEYWYAVFPDRVEAFEVDLSKFPTKPGEDITPGLKKIKEVSLK